jgi:hypothetical protein
VFLFTSHLCLSLLNVRFTGLPSRISLLSHTYHLSRTLHLLRFIKPIKSGEKHKLRTLSWCYFLNLLLPPLPLSTLRSDHVSLCSYLSVRDETCANGGGTAVYKIAKKVVSNSGWRLIGPADGLPLITYQSSLTCKKLLGGVCQTAVAPTPLAERPTSSTTQHMTPPRTSGSSHQQDHCYVTERRTVWSLSTVGALQSLRSSQTEFAMSTSAAKSMLLLIRFLEVPVRHLTGMWEILAEEYFRFRHSLTATPPTSHISHCILPLSFFACGAVDTIRAYTTEWWSLLDDTQLDTHTHTVGLV